MFCLTYCRNYDLLKNPGIGLTFYCNTDVGHSAYCAADGLVGYAPAVGAYSYVTLCDYFFNDIWSSTLCSQPGTQDPPDGITIAQFQNPAMQAGKY